MICWTRLGFQWVWVLDKGLDGAEGVALATRIPISTEAYLKVDTAGYNRGTAD